ncbi:MAG: UPF0365 family protein [Lentisphaerae bacterium]|jgi:uncharacterized protein YqfA (UPF0365 family)|nr:UPF0365 family protein [Lentisphaerota bacterium]
MLQVILLLSIVLAVASAILLLWFVAFVVRHFPLWLEANAAGLGVSFIDLLTIHLRKLQPVELVDCLKVMRKAGVEVTLADLQSHQLAGGNLASIKSAVVGANKAGIKLGYRDIAAIDLAGRDVRDAVDSHINPKVLRCPVPGQPLVDGREPGVAGIAKDGIRLEVKARVTVRTRLDRLVGGAGEATILARVGEGIVTAIGHADSHRQILESPELIAQEILKRGLDSGTCFEILSVDIADIDVMDNVAARLSSQQADADKRIARAKAEERRANAVASNQEMLSQTMAMRARVVEARENLPLAVAAACDGNNLGSPQPIAALLPATMRFE